MTNGLKVPERIDVNPEAVITCDVDAWGAQQIGGLEALAQAWPRLSNEKRACILAIASMDI